MLGLQSGMENNTAVANDSTWKFIWDNFGNAFITVLYYICLTILVFCLIVLFLRACGFGTIGIVGGSYAAGYQSTHEIVSGSCFSCFQSLAMRLGRILILSAITSGLLLYGCIKIREIFENTTPQNSTLSTFEQNWTESSTSSQSLDTISSLDLSDRSNVDTVTLFSKYTMQELSTLNASQATNLDEDISRSLAFEVNGTMDDDQNGSINIALRLQSDTVSQLLLLILAMLYLYA
ncbi:uncharacterized protein LOC129217438 [Uloborus diversus]|uniref:uncharacterized protein LOC129217438 n=1 Tax=Uloborus diversus TaxID=327109 RepID=UPI0024091092|nr:uncharacterized protein LOC129217438 [Uloborus diversus]